MLDEEQIEGKRIALEKDARKYESLKKGIRKESYSLKSNPATEATVHLPGNADTSQEVHGTAGEEADDKKVSAVYDNSIMGKETYKKIQSEAEARKPEFMYDGISNKETYAEAQRVVSEKGKDKATADLLSKAKKLQKLFGT